MMLWWNLRQSPILPIMSPTSSCVCCGCMNNLYYPRTEVTVYVRTKGWQQAASSRQGQWWCWLVAYIKSKYSLHFRSLSQYQEFQDSQNTFDQSTYNPCACIHRTKCRQFLHWNILSTLFSEAVLVALQVLEERQNSESRFLSTLHCACARY